MAIDLPSRSELDYTIAFDVAAIYVACPADADQPCLIACARHATRSAAHHPKTPRIVFIAWTYGIVEAQATVDRVRSNFSNGSPLQARTSGDMIKLIRQAANKIGVQLTDHDHAMVRVRKNIAEFSKLLAKAEGEGDLRFFNAAYRSYRLAESAQGRKTISYPEARRRLTRALLEAKAKNTVPPDLREIFMTQPAPNPESQVVASK
jgi:hypothetical protein